MTCDDHYLNKLRVRGVRHDLLLIVYILTCIHVNPHPSHHHPGKIIASAGLGFADCVEKSELRVRAKEALATLASRKAAAPPEGPRDVTLAGYDCSVLAPENPDLLIIILHGFGATKDDFSSIPGQLPLTQKRVAYVFPQAPAGAMGATAWWHLDAMKWMMAASGGGDSLATLIREEPPGLAECRVRLGALVGEARALCGDIPTSQVVLAGFSQGAMTAMDLALQLDEPVAGVTMLSGAPIVVDQWAASLKTKKGLKVFISHGRSDPVLPFPASGWCRDLLTSGGAAVTFHEHGGGHDLGQTTLAPLAAFWSSL